MRWIRLRSRVIHLVGWDAAQGELLLRFASGKLYVFRQVEPEVAADIIEAKAPGSAFSASLRQSPYSERVNGFPCATDALLFAKTAGYGSLSLTGSGRRRANLRRMGLAGLMGLASSLDTDQDCTGEHTWFFTGADRDQICLWHINERTGFVVPPTPRLAWRAGSSPQSA